MSTIRKIAHIDCDSFYASIEIRDNPSLAGLPIAVGGSPERRGVIATCNYLAREYGVHSAMASTTARRLCPGLIIIRPEMARYRVASQQIHEIFRDYTDIIEPLSLDEAFLDLSDCQLNDGSASRIVSEIRARIASEVNITVSAGIAPNKFLAKVASDWNKPDGQYVIEPPMVDSFVRELPVRKLFGVGKVTAARMEKLGIRTCQDLRAMDREQLDRLFGSFGNRLFELCRGVDNRPVQPTRVRKSISVENTFATDLPDLPACLAELPGLHQQLLERIERLNDIYQVSKQVVKIKFHDFVSTTVETLSQTTELEKYRELLEEGYQRGQRPVRLLGIGAKLSPTASESDNPASVISGEDPIQADAEAQLALFRDR
jgi:DNA polymerase-4